MFDDTDRHGPEPSVEWRLDHVEAPKRLTSRPFCQSSMAIRMIRSSRVMPALVTQDVDLAVGIDGAPRPSRSVGAVTSAAIIDGAPAKRLNLGERSPRPTSAGQRPRRRCRRPGERRCRQMALPMPRGPPVREPTCRSNDHFAPPRGVGADTAVAAPRLSRWQSRFRSSTAMHADAEPDRATRRAGGNGFTGSR